jgi:tRNA pseudouridine38-40 synthase
MHEASQFLLGEQDFTSFRSVECQSKTPMRNVQRLEVTRNGDLIIVDINANAFLHHMVRNIVGVLIAVGSGRQSVEWVKDVLLAKDRKLGAETAPSYGLYLVGVEYPSEFYIPQAFSGPIFLLGGL